MNYSVIDRQAISDSLVVTVIMTHEGLVPNRRTQISNDRGGDEPASWEGPIQTAHSLKLR